MEQKQVYAFEINEDGYIIGSLLADPNNLGNNKVITPIPPDVIFKPRWTGSKWIEGATQAEIDEITKPQPIIPTLEQRIAELENTILNLLEVL